MEPARTDAADDPDALAPIFLRMRSVVRLTGLGRSTIYRMIAHKTFPGPVRIGPGAVAWRRADLERWGQERTEVTH